MWPLILVVGFICFLIYWIFGGIFFACLALLRLRRLRKARFSCLFSLSSFVIAFGSSWFGFTSLIDKKCFSEVDKINTILKDSLFFCDFWTIFWLMLGGFFVQIIVGFFLLKISSWQDRSWLTSFTERLEWNKEDDETEEGREN